MLTISEGKLNPNLFNTKFPILDLSIIPKGISAELRTNIKPLPVSSILSIVFHNLSLLRTLTKLSIGFLKSPINFLSHFFMETVFKIFSSTKPVHLPLFATKKYLSAESFLFFINVNILKTVPLKKWERYFVGDFKKPIDSFESVYSDDKLWKTIERLEETREGFILVLNSADIPLGIIDRSKIGNFVLNKLGFNLPSEIINKLNYKNQYPLGIELPRIINSMKQKGDL